MVHVYSASNMRHSLAKLARRQFASICDPCSNQLVGVVVKPRWMACCWLNAILGLLAEKHFSNLLQQNRGVWFPRCIDCKINANLSDLWAELQFLFFVMLYCHCFAGWAAGICTSGTLWLLLCRHLQIHIVVIARIAFFSQSIRVKCAKRKDFASSLKDSKFV